MFEIGSLPKGGGCVVKGSFLVCLEFFKTHSFYISVFLGGPPVFEEKTPFSMKNRNFLRKTSTEAPRLQDKPTGGCGMWDVGSLE